MRKPLELARYSQPCGCGLSLFEGNLVDFITCPKHEATDDLLAALEASVAEHKHNDWCKSCELARAAIAKAKLPA